MILQYLVQEATHISNIRKLKANFCGREKEGHFHYKKLFESFKMSTHMMYLHNSYKIPALWLATMFWEPIREKHFVPTV